MSKTYTADLVQYRMEPVHDEYRRRVDDLRQIPPKTRRDHPRYETMCPYCGTDNGNLKAHVRVGGKKLVPHVPLATDGFEIRGVSERKTKEILIIYCDECGAAMPETAFLSPIVFMNDKEDAERVLQKVARLRAED